jgi:hypothetical protein
MKTDPLKDTELHDKINRETARINWSELERHFAHGAVVYVSEDLDLVEVALRIAHDDKEQHRALDERGQGGEGVGRCRPKPGRRPTPCCGHRWSVLSCWCSPTRTSLH